jgi:hypothetical protein
MTCLKTSPLANHHHPTIPYPNLLISEVYVIRYKIQNLKCIEIIHMIFDVFMAAKD